VSKVARLATSGDFNSAVGTLAGAFYNDPVWSWAFPDSARRRAQHSAWFELVVATGLENDSVWTTGDCESIAVWVPPGCDELSPERQDRFAPMLEEMLGSRAALVMDVFGRFEASHPHDRDHYYLSMIGTHPDHRGRGTGMALLAETLTAIDAEGTPAYLESSNPANVKRYESVGFVVTGSFALPEDGPDVTTMWREPHTS
jgi:ribosomal protein S18 acetylase RimI-like enzyme